MKNSIIIGGLLLIATFSSCRKTIEIAVDEKDKKYVIEGNITDQYEPASVRISRSISLNATNEFPEVSGAEVNIIDLNNDQTLRLTETEKGFYHSAAVAGIPGHQYQLVVKINGALFTATSVLPAPVSLDSVYISKSWAGTEVKGMYRDPIGSRNYYHYVLHRNGMRMKGVGIANDEASDGQGVTRAMIAVHDTLLKQGDHIKATLEAIDPAMYQYYYGLAMGADQSYSAPANPKSNIIGNVLGYFSAHTRSTSEIVVQ
jgi:hypothetical protein